MRTLTGSLAFTCLALLGATASMPAPAAAQGDQLSVSGITVEPAEINAGMFFDGAGLTVRAELPEGTAVAVACIGQDGSVVLNRKGKVLGLIWMNVGEVEFDDTPSLYLLNTTSDLGRLATISGLEALGVGYDALQARAGTVGSEMEDVRLFQELVRLKESEGLFGIAEGAVHTEPASSGTVSLTTDFYLPAKTPPGEYRVLIYGFRQGEGSLLGSTSVRVNQVGAAALISSLATEHGLVYGILAVLVAISVGLLTGMVFGLGSKKAH